MTDVSSNYDESFPALDGFNNCTTDNNSTSHHINIEHDHHQQQQQQQQQQHNKYNSNNNANNNINNNINNNNINNNNTTTNTTNSNNIDINSNSNSNNNLSSSTANHATSISATSTSTSSSSAANKPADNNIVTDNTIPTNSWSAASQKKSGQQTKLNYLLLSNNHHHQQVHQPKLYQQQQINQDQHQLSQHQQHQQPQSQQPPQLVAQQQPQQQAQVQQQQQPQQQQPQQQQQPPQQQRQQHQEKRHTQQQQVLDHIVSSDHNSNAVVSQYHLQSQQQHQEQLDNNIDNLINTNGNNTTASTTITQQNTTHTQRTTATTFPTSTTNTSSPSSSSSTNNMNTNNTNMNTNNTSTTTPQSTTTSNNNNNNNNSNAMRTNSSIRQNKKPGVPNPIIRSERCCTFKISLKERRHRDFELEQSKILKDIMQTTNTKIEVTTTKDGALNFCIIGKEQNLPNAKNLILTNFQTTVTSTLSVPKSIHGRLLGPKGARLISIEEETLTKINIPRKEDDSDIIKITGLKNNVETAIRSIQKYASEYAGKAVEKVTVERNYLLFITGPFNESFKRWEELGAKVSTSGGILSNKSNRDFLQPDEVTFTIQGETSVVGQVKDEIMHIYEDKKKKCTTVNMEVKKAQHKYILGPGGQNLRNLFAKTGVSVELPHESESETITLRGERSKLAPALSELYTQAHSETDDYLEVETWLHKYLIGIRKTLFIDFKAHGVDVKSMDDKIKLHGPPTEVENIKELLETELQTVRKTIVRKDIRVEPRIHGYIIGKSGATVDQIREESGAYVFLPKNDEASDHISLEGTAEAVAIAEEKINAIAKKYESSRKLAIDQQLHGSIIGRGGKKIRSIRDKFPQVVFTFPEPGSRNNEITILGPSDEVEECYKYLDKFHQQLKENNNQAPTNGNNNGNNSINNSSNSSNGNSGNNKQTTDANAKPNSKRRTLSRKVKKDSKKGDKLGGGGGPGAGAGGGSSPAAVGGEKVGAGAGGDKPVGEKVGEKAAEKAAEKVAEKVAEKG